MDTELFKPLIKSFLGQMDSAMKVSDVLASHESSDETTVDEITVDHIITGLVYRLMVPMTNEEVTEALDSAQQILDKLDEPDSEEDELEQSTTLDENIDFGSRKVKPNNCNCSVCMKARVCLINYHTFDCSDPLADKFKKAIQTTCEKHKIYI